jgi:hypothetical protein
MVGLAAIGAPSRVSQAVSKNDALKQATSILESFKDSETYQSLPQATGTPVEAYRAFEKVAKDEAATPEQKQEAFNVALRTLVDNPHSNTAKIVEGLKKNATEAGITLDAPVEELFTTLSTPSQSLTEKVVKGGQGILRDVKLTATKKSLSPEAVDKSPALAMDTLVNRGFTFTNREEMHTQWDDAINTWEAINASLAKSEDFSQEERKAISEEALAKIYEQKNTLKRAMLAGDIGTKVEAIAKASQEDRINNTTLGSDITSIIESLNPSKPELVTDEQLDVILGSGAVTPEEKAVIKEYKEIRKSMMEVSADVYNGKDKYKGINQYENQITGSIEVGNKADTDSRLKDYSDWVKQHTAKAEKVNAAYAEAKGFTIEDSIIVIEADGKELKIPIDMGTHYYYYCAFRKKQ